MESHRLKDDEESVRAALSSLKTATGIPVTMYATLLPDNRLQNAVGGPTYPSAAESDH